MFSRRPPQNDTIHARGETARLYKAFAYQRRAIALYPYPIPNTRVIRSYHPAHSYRRRNGPLVCILSVSWEPSSRAPLFVAVVVWLQMRTSFFQIRFFLVRVTGSRHAPSGVCCIPQSTQISVIHRAHVLLESRTFSTHRRPGMS